MTTQTFEFNATPGLTITCKLFAWGSDTILGTAVATPYTNDPNRYHVDFEDQDAGVYRLVGFVGGIAGYVNEIYDVLALTGTYTPRSEQTLSVTVLPISSSSPDRSRSTTEIVVYQNETPSVSVSVADVTLTGKTLRFVVENSLGEDVLVRENADITKTATTFTVVISTAVSGSINDYIWCLRDVNNGNLNLAYGPLKVKYAPDKDT